MSWKKKPCPTPPASNPLQKVCDMHDEGIAAFASYDYVRGSALLAAATSGIIAHVLAIAKPDTGACEDCGHHVCSCEVAA